MNFKTVIWKLYLLAIRNIFPICSLMEKYILCSSKQKTLLDLNMKQLAQDHTATKWHSKNFNYLTPNCASNCKGAAERRAEKVENVYWKLFNLKQRGKNFSLIKSQITNLHIETTYAKLHIPKCIQLILKRHPKNRGRFSFFRNSEHTVYTIFKIFNTHSKTWTLAKIQEKIVLVKCSRQKEWILAGQHGTCL